MKVTLGEMFVFIRNGLSVKQDSQTGGLPISRIETISDSKIDSQRVGYANLIGSKYDDWLLRSDDILFSHINSIKHLGKCAIYEGEPSKLVHGMNLLCFRPIKTIVCPRYLLHYFRSAVFRPKLERFIKPAVNQASVSIKDLKSIEVELPPLEEQRRIAEVLDKADALRQKRRLALQKLDTLLQSVFLEMFGDPLVNPKGWKILPLGEILVGGLANGLYKPASELGSGFVLLDNKGLYRGLTAHFAEPRRVRLSDSEFKKYSLQIGDVLFNRVSVKPEGVGKAVWVDKLPEPSVFESNIMRSRVNTSIVHPEFLVHFLALPKMRGFMISRSNVANQASVNQEIIRALPIQLPPLKEQARFISIMRRHDSAIYVRLKSSINIDRLFQSIQERAFNGELF